MKTPSVFLLSLALLSLGEISAQVTKRDVVAALDKPSLIIGSPGREREYVIAKDKLSMGKKNGDIDVAKSQKAVSTKELLDLAEAHQRATGERTLVVLHPKGEQPTEENKTYLTQKVYVKLVKGLRAITVAREVGARVLQEPDYSPGSAILEVAEIGAGVAVAERLRTRPGVLDAQPIITLNIERMLVPNDPFYPAVSGNQTTGQWHLRPNSTSAFSHVNVQGVWDEFLGNGVGIGIIDDGLQYTHPDLAPNANTADDIDFLGGDNDPLPDGRPRPPTAPEGDAHGTAVGGVAAAYGNNNLGVTGAAPRATLYGIRIIGTGIDETHAANALAYRPDIIHIKNNSWGMPAPYFKWPSTLVNDAILSGVATGRGGLGTIYLFSAGNNGLVGYNANARESNNSRYVICVGATDFYGLPTSYSQRGACVTISAPSGAGNVNITTTDLIGAEGYNRTAAAPNLSDLAYTNDFNGTSSATPLVAGCIALILNANPALGWRDVKEILIRSATRPYRVGSPILLDLGPPITQTWRTNSANYAFSHHYGAGIINTDAAVVLAKQWTKLGPEGSFVVPALGNNTIPDNNTVGVRRTVIVPAGMRVEHVELTVTVDHARRGDLDIRLVAPSGMHSIMLDANPLDSGANISAFTFSSVRHWGEASGGAWDIVAIDRRSGITGVLREAVLTFWGADAAINTGPRDGGGIADGGSNAGGGSNGGGGKNAGGGRAAAGGNNAGGGRTDRSASGGRGLVGAAGFAASGAAGTSATASGGAAGGSGSAAGGGTSAGGGAAAAGGGVSAGGGR